MADVKEIAVTASVDVGKNITEVVEKLAHQIGITADKIFPWYVQQQVIEGYMTIILLVVALAVAIVTLTATWKKSDFDEGNLHAVFVVISIVLLCSAVLFMLFVTTIAVSKILNPNFYALKAMTGDMARLLGK